MSRIKKNTDYHHDEMQKMELTLKVRGDVAASIYNAFVIANSRGELDSVIFCEHSVEGVAKMLAEIINQLELPVL